MARVISSLGGVGGSNITKTSQLINDGEFPEDGAKFIENVDLPSLVGDIIVVEGLGDKNFIHHQNFPSATWEINHDLDKKPSVTITDSADTVVEGQIIINDGVKVLITFNAPFTGIAILN